MTIRSRTWLLSIACIFTFSYAQTVAQENTAACGSSYEGVSGDTPQKALGVCGLDGQGGGPLFFAEYSESNGLALQAPIDFQVRSCTNVTCRYATQYNVQLDSLSGANFSLSNNGNTIPLSFSFNQLESGQSALLSPGTLTNIPFNSKANGQYTNASLDFSLAMTPSQLAALAPGTYTGSFSFSIEQEPRWVTIIFFPVDFGSETLSDMVFDVQLEVLPNVKIFGLEDINLEPNPGGSFYARKTERFCVFSQGGGNFSVLGESTRGGSQEEFQLENGSGERVPYEVELRNQRGPGQFVQLTEGEATPYLWEGNTNPESCTPSVENMRIRVSVRSAAIEAIGGGTYQDTLRLTVTPE